MTGFRPACRRARSEPDARPSTLCRPRAILAAMRNLYSITKGQQAVRDLARAMRDNAGNMPPLPGIFPDYSAPIVRTAPDGLRELTMARWGMPSAAFDLKFKVYSV
jgi:putative SOS response-associated peptidase YedK